MKNRAFITMKSLIVVVVGWVAIFAGLLFFLSSPNYTKGFENLHELQEFAKTLDEWIKKENKDMLSPSYDNYFKSISYETLLEQLKNKIQFQLARISDIFRPNFSLSLFKNLLRDITNQRKNKYGSDDFVEKIVINDESKLIVFETLQGAFHSMSRYLTKLNELNIIDSNFKLKNGNFYFIFFGNVFNRAPYNLELFTLILRIMERNPDNVIFIKGINEFYDYWKNLTLQKELTYRILEKSKDFSVLQDAISFCNTLSLTLYCVIESTLNTEKTQYFKLVPIFYKPEHNKFIQDARFSSFISQSKQKKVEFEYIAKPSELFKYADKIWLRAIIKDIRKRDEYEKNQGLRLLDINDSVPVWTIMSTASEQCRLGLNHFHESFALIEYLPERLTWKINSYYRDVRSKLDEFDVAGYNFFTGKKL